MFLRDIDPPCCMMRREFPISDSGPLTGQDLLVYQGGHSVVVPINMNRVLDAESARGIVVQAAATALARLAVMRGVVR